jgi:formamidopyrimidine-DNA glycosylase
VAIKQALLAGDVVVGAGNIYACEALFHAGIDPRTRSERISRPRAARLAKAVREVLARALEVGGSTLRDFSDAHGVAGAFQDETRVYGREGLRCHACQTPIRRVVQAQRSSFFCPRCQRR